MQLYQTQVADANAVFTLVIAAHTHMGIKLYALQAISHEDSGKLIFCSCYVTE